MIGAQSLRGHIDNLGDMTDLQRLITLDDAYTTFTSSQNTKLVSNDFCKSIQNSVQADDILNLQFTSGRPYPSAERGMFMLTLQAQRGTLKLPCSHTCMYATPGFIRKLADKTEISSTTPNTSEMPCV